jgi:hypothetical protein
MPCKPLLLSDEQHKSSCLLVPLLQEVSPQLRKLRMGRLGGVPNRSVARGSGEPEDSYGPHRVKRGHWWAAQPLRHSAKSVGLHVGPASKPN